MGARLPDENRRATAARRGRFGFPEQSPGGPSGVRLRRGSHEDSPKGGAPPGFERGHVDRDGTVDGPGTAQPPQRPTIPDGIAEVNPGGRSSAAIAIYKRYRFE